jgi:hypothetical protein
LPKGQYDRTKAKNKKSTATVTKVAAAKGKPGRKPGAAKALKATTVAFSESKFIHLNNYLNTLIAMKSADINIPAMHTNIENTLSRLEAQAEALHPVLVIEPAPEAMEVVAPSTGGVLFSNSVTPTADKGTPKKRGPKPGFKRASAVVATTEPKITTLAPVVPVVSNGAGPAVFNPPASPASSAS